MTKHEAYNGIYDNDGLPDTNTHRVFFAFNDEQFREGMEKFGYQNQSEIVSPGIGLYGPPECVKSFMDEYGKMEDRVRNECDPQKVYEYEFTNHECEYLADDREAIQIVVSIFGNEKARLVQRRYAWVEI